MEVSGSILKSFDQVSQVCSEEKDGELDFVFGLVNGLAEQVEEGFLAVLDALVLAKLDTWGGDRLASKAVEVTLELEPNLFQFVKIIRPLDVLHDLHDLAFLGSGIEDGLF
jgi:hypothetical protein